MKRRAILTAMVVLLGSAFTAGFLPMRKVSLADNPVALMAQSKTPEKQAAQQTPKTAIDPVCGMEVDPAKAGHKSEYKGKTYFFCSAHCKKDFDANPEAILNKNSKKKN